MYVSGSGFLDDISEYTDRMRSFYSEASSSVSICTRRGQRDTLYTEITYRQKNDSFDECPRRVTHARGIRIANGGNRRRYTGSAFVTGPSVLNTRRKPGALHRLLRETAFAWFTLVPSLWSKHNAILGFASEFPVPNRKARWILKNCDAFWPFKWIWNPWCEVKMAKNRVQKRCTAQLCTEPGVLSNERSISLAQKTRPVHMRLAAEDTDSDRN